MDTKNPFFVPEMNDGWNYAQELHINQGIALDAIMLKGFERAFQVYHHSVLTLQPLFVSGVKAYILVETERGKGYVG